MVLQNPPIIYTNPYNITLFLILFPVIVNCVILLAQMIFRDIVFPTRK